MQYGLGFSVNEVWRQSRWNKLDPIDGDQGDLTNARNDVRATAIAVVVTSPGRLLRTTGTGRIRIATCGKGGVNDQNVGRGHHEKHESCKSHDPLPLRHLNHCRIHGRCPKLLYRHAGTFIRKVRHNMVCLLGREHPRLR